jgi:hypothetical protein
MIPASQLEKFIISMINAILIYFIFCTAALYFAGYVYAVYLKSYTGKFIYPINIFAMEERPSILIFTLLQCLALLGSLLFQKQKLIKTLAFILFFAFLLKTSVINNIPVLQKRLESGTHIIASDLPNGIGRNLNLYIYSVATVCVVIILTFVVFRRLQLKNS